jgi:uncharacterized protein
MFISLQQLERRPVRFKVDIPAGEIEYDSNTTQTSVLHAEGSARLLSRSLGEVRIEGNLSVTVEATCDRCLEAAALPINHRFDLVYMPSGESGAIDDEIDKAGIEVGYYEGNGLRLEEILREVVLLALPMRLVCSDACKGICPVCGLNRNQGDCGGHAEAVDDRWSQLKTFRAEIGPNN